jgi:hypothetical protein
MPGIAIGIVKEKIMAARYGSAAKTAAFHARSVMKTGCMLAFVLSANFSHAQTAPPVGPATQPQTKPAETRIVVAPKVTYVNGQLKIEAVGATLAEVLARVAALSGVSIELPAGAPTERMAFVELGPGPPREILASLLSDSNFDYLIQASDADPSRIQSVLLMAKDKKGSVPEPGGRPTHSPFVRASASPVKSEETPVSENNTAPPPENAIAEASPNPQTAESDQATQADLAAPTSIPTNSLQIPLAQPGLSKGAMTPPASLTPTAINQQLQQMYQQRMQMIQQGQPSQSQSVR